MPLRLRQADLQRAPQVRGGFAGEHAGPGPEGGDGTLDIIGAVAARPLEIGKTEAALDSRPRRPVVCRRDVLQRLGIGSDGTVRGVGALSRAEAQVFVAELSPHLAQEVVAT